MIPMAQHLEQDANSWDVFVLQRHAGCPTPQSQFQRETEAGSTKAANWGGPEPQPRARWFCTAVAWSTPTIAPNSSSQGNAVVYTPIPP